MNVCVSESEYTLVELKSKAALRESKDIQDESRVENLSELLDTMIDIEDRKSVV